ncbi:hypothetical protein DERF_006436 [Dermatophagoides farinae]|uniref:BLOC-1-related complex subunit 6 C-terminal helix domain-containing protein n=1 Tax=Dermatophagoides farinae TaxID=6954 RepID=A0A922IAC8_DERFA|nr:hypothetical protein DERF_006436 [Dermatophagoides farinae]
MDLEPDDSSKTPLSSPPSTEEASMCPDYISSYTQISQFNHDNDDETVGDHTDIESESDNEFVNDGDDYEQKSFPDLKPKDSKKKDPIALPELSSQIIEWSKKTFESYQDSNEEERPNRSETRPPQLSSEPPSGDGLVDDRNEKEKLKFFQMKFIMDIETQAMMIAENLNQIMTYLNSYSTNVTTSSTDVMEIYRDNVFDTCDHIDADIKLMYKIISKCEELNKSLQFLDELRNRIKDIKQTLDTFERIIM